MGLYSEHVLPRAIDWLLGKPEFAELRRRAVPQLAGTVLEVGFGSGLNLPHFPAQVERLIALDPARIGRKLARARIEASPVPVEFAELGRNGGYPLDSGSVDCVLSTWTLCTIRDLDRALLEMRRVLAPHGVLVFLEHGLSPDPKLAKWQRRVTRVHRLWAGGCRLDVPIAGEIQRAGFAIERLETYAFAKAGSLAGWMYEGVARPGV